MWFCRSELQDVGVQSQFFMVLSSDLWSLSFGQDFLFYFLIGFTSDKYT